MRRLLVVALGVLVFVGLSSCENIFGPYNNSRDADNPGHGRLAYSLTVQASPQDGGDTTGGGVILTSAASTNVATATITAGPTSDYNFAGWTTTSSTVTAIASPSSLKTTVSLDGDAAIQGTFTLKPYTVTYDGNGADGGTAPVDSHHYNQGDTFVVSGNTGNLVRSGYTFAGWNTQADGNGSNYTKGDTFTMPASNATLYAVWNKQINGGTGVNTPSSYTVTISGPTTLHYGSQASFSSSYTGTATSYAWYLDTSTTVIGNAESLSVTPTVSTYTYGAHVLTLVVTDANGLLYSGTYSITVEN